MRITLKHAVLPIFAAAIALSHTSYAAETTGQYVNDAAITTKVNAQGQVEGTCVGTGMAFDPAFYYSRPTSAFAAHGYGPVLLAGAEMILIDKSGRPGITEGAVQFGRLPSGAQSP